MSDASTTDAQDWQKYSQHSPLRRQYEQSGGILYRTSVLAQEEYRAIQDDLATLIGKGGRLRLADETNSSVAVNRVGARLPPDCKTIEILSDPNNSISRLINEIEGCQDNSRMVFSLDVPGEVRIYEQTGSGMEWHVDDELYTPAQVEVVLTMDNTSDCRTIWEEQRKGADATVREVETVPNSAVLLKAGCVRHRVSALRTGRRVILKFVFIRAGATFIEGQEKHTNQFSSSTLNSRKNKKKRQK